MEGGREGEGGKRVGKKEGEMEKKRLQKLVTSPQVCSCFEMIRDVSPVPLIKMPWSRLDSK